MNNIPQQGFYFDGSLNKFGKPKHDYFYDGKLMTGVTSVLGIIGGDKAQNLIQWAADLAAIAGLEAEQIIGIKAEYDAIQKIEDWKEKKKAKEELDKKYPLYHEARTTHNKKKEEAGAKGTNVHAEIEKYIKLMISDQDGIAHEINGYENKQFENFVSWAFKNRVKFLESEKKIYSTEWFCAGTADFTCEIDGKRFVGDIKTGGVYDRIPFFQTAAYRKMLIEMGEKDYDGSCVINIKKDGKFDETRDVMWSYDYQTDLEGFLAALKIYRIMRNY